jgi:hypothetical protein
MSGEVCPLPLSFFSPCNAFHSCLNSRLFLCFGLFGLLGYWIIGLMAVTPSLAKIFRAVADAIKAESVPGHEIAMNGISSPLDTF